LAPLLGLNKDVVKDPNPPGADLQTSPITIPNGIDLVTTKTTNETIDNVNQIIDYISGDVVSNFIPQSAIFELVSDLTAKEDTINKGAASGYAGLDAFQELFLANFPGGSALQVLRRNMTNTALEFADPIGEVFTWSNDHDAATNNLLNMGQLFIADTALPDTAASIYAQNTGNISINARATEFIFLRIGGIQQYNFGLNEANFLGHNLENVANFDLSGTLELNSTQLLQWASPATGFITANSAEMEIGVGSADQIIFTIDTAIDMILSANQLNLNGSHIDAFTYLEASGAATTDAGQLRLANLHTIEFRNVGNSANIGFGVNASDEFFFDATINLQGSNIVGVTDLTLTNDINMSEAGQIIWAGVSDRRILNNSSGFFFDVSLGDTFIWQIDNALKMTLSSTGLNMNGGRFEEINFISFLGAEADAGTIRLNVTADIAWRNNAGSANLDLSVNGSDQLTFNGAVVQTGSPSLTPWTENIDGAGNNLLLNGGELQFDTTQTRIHQEIGNVLEFNVDATLLLSLDKNGAEIRIENNALRILESNATGLFTIEANHSTPANGQIVGQIDFVDDSSTGTRRTYGQIRTVIQVATDAAEDGAIFFDVIKGGAASTFFVVNEQNGDDVEFKKNVVMDSGIEMGVGTMPAAGEIKFSQGESSLAWDATTGFATFGLTTLDEFRMSMNGEEYLFGKTTADFLGNGIDNVLSLTMDGLNPGKLSMNVANFQIEHVSGGSIQLRDNIGVNYEFNNSLANFMNNNLINMGILKFAEIAQVFSGSEATISRSTNELTLQAETSGQVGIVIGTSLQYTFTNSIFDMRNNALDMGSGILSFIDTNTSLQQSGSDLQIDVATGGAHLLRINNASEFSFNVLAGFVSSRRIQGNQGADVVSAATITLGNDGNYFVITGNTNVDFMTIIDWQAGAMVTLQFDGNVTVNDNTGSAPVNTVPFAIATSFVAGDGDTLTVIFDGTFWREISRSVN